MKKFRKSLATILSFLMCFSLLSNVAYAHGTESDLTDSSADIIYSEDIANEDMAEEALTSIEGDEDQIIPDDFDVIEGEDEILPNDTVISDDEDMITSDESNIEENSIEESPQTDESDSLDFPESDSEIIVENEDSDLYENEEEVFTEDTSSEEVIVEVVSEEITDTEEVFLSGTENGIEINEENFPDEAFRNYISNNFDTNISDGILDEDEISNITSIYVSYSGIESLSGIENFTALENLVCSDNELTNLNISNNAKLSSLSCSYCQLNDLDVSRNTALSFLNCGYNNLSELDLRNNPNLEILDCSYNSNLVSLDLSNNTALTSLNCMNTGISELDVTKNTELEYLECESCNLKELDISNNNKLRNFNCWNSKIKLLDISHCPYLIDLYQNGEDYGNTYSLENGKYVLSVNSNTYIITDENEITQGDLVVEINEESFPDDNFRLLVSEYDFYPDGWLSSQEIEIIKSINGNYYDFGEINSFAGIEFLTSLKELNLSYQYNITSLDVSHNTELAFLNCSQTSLTSLDTSNNQKLVNLQCENVNYLTSLDLSKNTELVYLNCCNCDLSELDVSHNIKLENLICYGNSFKKLNLSNNDKLEYLDCSDSNLIYVDISSCPYLLDAVVNGERNDYGNEKLYYYSNNGSGYLAVNYFTNIITDENNFIQGDLVVEINEENFPDEIFKQIIQEYDLFSDGWLSSQEIEKIKYLDGSYYNMGEIASFKGIEYLTSLEYLNCSSQWNLTSLDLSNNLSLTRLDCYGDTKLTSLNIRNNSKLTDLHCDSIGVEELDVSNNINLLNLNCSYLNIKTIDLSNNDKLKSLYCQNSLMRNLDISHCPDLIDTYINGEKYDYNSGEITYHVEDGEKYLAVKTSTCIITNEDEFVSGDLEVEINEENFPDELFRTIISEYDYYPDGWLSRQENERIKGIQISNSIGTCSSVKGIEYLTSLEYFDCYNQYTLSSLDLSKNIELKALKCDYCNIVELDLSQNINLVRLNCDGYSIKKLDLTNNEKLKDLYCPNSSILYIDISHCPYLVDAFVNGNKVDDGYGQIYYYSVDGEACLSVNKITNVISDENEITPGDLIVEINEENFPDENFRLLISAFDLYSDGWLSSQELSRITNVDASYYTIGEVSSFKGIEYLTSLESFDCSNQNKLDYVDLSNNQNLYSLNCFGLQNLSSLDISNNLELKFLNCSSMSNLTSLDLSKNDKLTELYCNDTSIRELDISNNANLVRLYCSASDNLKALDLSNNSKLNDLSCYNVPFRFLNISNCPKLIDAYLNNDQHDYGYGYVYYYSENSDSQLTIGYGNCVVINENDYTPGDLEVEISEAYFPDDVFRSLISEYDYYPDGWLSRQEIERIKGLKVDTSVGICYSLEGIEYLSSLEKLDCSNQYNLTSLELSQNTKLNYLNCKYSGIKELDLSQNVELNYLDCCAYSLRRLNISNNYNLKKLLCYDNSINYLDITHCPYLTDVFLYGEKFEDWYNHYQSIDGEIVLNVGKDIYVVADESLNTPGDLVVEINEENFPDENFRLFLNEYDFYHDGWLSSQEIERIKKIECYSIGEVSSLDGIEYLTSLEYLNCSSQNSISSLDLSKNTKLTHLDCSYLYNLTSLNINNNTDLIYLNCLNTSIKKLDISSCEKLLNLLNYYNESYGYYYISYEESLITGNILLVYPGSGMDNIIVEINEESFPDEIFREKYVRTFDIDEDGKLSEAEIKSVTSIGIYSSYNSNTLSSINGIEYFTSLKRLEIYENSNALTEIDLSNNKELTYLSCYWCSKLQNINISQNTKLSTVYLEGCKNLYSLDLSNNANLTFLYITYADALEQLDISHNTDLASLSLYRCKKINQIDISKNSKLTMLSCVENGMDVLNISECPILVGIIDSKNYSSSYDRFSYSYYDSLNSRTIEISVGLNTKLIYLKESELGADVTAIDATAFPDEELRNYVSKFDQNSDNILSEKEIEIISSLNLNGKSITSMKGLELLTSLRELRVAECNLSELDISNNIALETLDCGGNSLVNLDISNNARLTTLICRDNNIKTIDLSKNNSLKVLDCSENPFGRLDISRLPIYVLNCSNCSLDELTCNDRLFALNCSHNNLSKINNLNLNNVNNYNYLSYDYYSGGLNKNENYYGYTLDISDNKIAELDISQFKNLYDLNCSNNQLSELNLDNLKQLYNLNCSNNNITQINTRNNKNLYVIDCSHNNISSIEIPNVLGWLYCSYNQLTELDVSKISYGCDCSNNKIESIIFGESGYYFKCYNNNISSLDVSNNRALLNYVYASTKDGKTLYTSEINLNNDWTVDNFNVMSYLIVDEETSVIPITKKYAIIFHLNESPASAARGDSVDVDSDYTLPNCEFAAPTGYLFDKWKVNIGDKDAVYNNPGDVIKITANTKVYAVWKAKTDIAYKVEHYKQGLDGEYTISPEVENFTGTTDASIQPALKNYDGFTAPDVQTVTIKADGSLVVKYYYSRNNYNLTWDYNGGTASGEYTIGVLKYEAPITAPTLTRDGYSFDGWDVTVPETMPAKDLTIKAKWKVINGISYKVEHYKQDFDGKYNSSPEVENLTGATGESIKPAVKSYEGFTAPAVKTETIKADGSLVVKYYYTRNSYKITWNLDGGSASNTYTNGTIKYGASITAPTLTKTGYSFNGWDVSVPSTMPAKDLTIKAKWSANINTAYKVEHYKQGLDGKYTASPEVENLKGTTGASVKPSLKKYEGFVAPSAQTVTIKADGSLVVKYFYTRNSYKITWNLDGGKASGTYTSGTVKYGASITAPTVTKDGYTFEGWNATVLSTMPAKDLSYTAKWKKAEQTQDELVTDFVKRFYKEVLGRSQKAIEEDEAGITDWANKLINKEKTGAQVAQGFVNSKEFKNRGVSDEEYVTIMYVAFFGRDPDEGGYNGWLSKLKSGTSREAVLAGFTNSKEFQNLCAKYGIEPGKLDTNGQSQQSNNQQNNNNQSGMRPPLKLDSSNVDEKQLDDFVERLYDQVLGRKSDEGGKAYWLSAIMEGHDDRGNTYDAAIAIRKGFFESKEYLNKGRTDDEFLVDLYHAFFGRDPDAEGYAYWQNKMKNEGYTRQRVIDEGFGHSKEFKNLLTSYGFKIIE